jgi:hypothetical protein
MLSTKLRCNALEAVARLSSATNGTERIVCHLTFLTRVHAHTHTGNARSSISVHCKQCDESEQDDAVADVATKNGRMIMSALCTYVFMAQTTRQ